MAFGEPTNSDRAAWAATGLEAFEAACGGMAGEDGATKVRDLVSDLVHYLRLDCGMSLEEAREEIAKAVRMAEMEASEDSDQ